MPSFSLVFQTHFNPRTHEGSVLSVNKHLISLRNFNPRTHEGCDRYHQKVGSDDTDFNPRTHEGCDISPDPQLANTFRISIPAPTKGATQIKLTI